MKFNKLTDDKLEEIINGATKELSKRCLRKAKEAGIYLRKKRYNRVEMETPLGKLVFYENDGYGVQFNDIDLSSFMFDDNGDPNPIDEGDACDVIEAFPDKGNMCEAALKFFNRYRDFLNSVLVEQVQSA